MNASNGLAAGLVLVVVLAACTAAGILVGAGLGSRPVGGVAGGVAGVVLSGLAVHRLFLRPFRRQLEAHDYSHLRPLDDDE